MPCYLLPNTVVVTKSVFKANQDYFSLTLHTQVDEVVQDKGPKLIFFFHNVDKQSFHRGLIKTKCRLQVPKHLEQKKH